MYKEEVKWNNTRAGGTARVLIDQIRVRSTEDKISNEVLTKTGFIFYLRKEFQRNHGIKDGMWCDITFKKNKRKKGFEGFLDIEKIAILPSDEGVHYSSAEPIYRKLGDRLKQPELPIGAKESQLKFEVCNACGTWRTRPCGEGCTWNLA